MNPPRGNYSPSSPQSGPWAGPPAGRDDAEHLRLLALFHYIYAGFIAVFGLLGAAFFVFGIYTATSARPTAQTPNPTIAGVIMAGAGVAVMIFVFGAAFLIYLAGRFLKQRRHRMFCIVISAIQCASFPLGTALGVFTIIVLARHSVIAMFDQAERAAKSPPPGMPPFHASPGDSPSSA